MIFVLILLTQSLSFVWYYREDLSLLINSEAEVSFIHYLNERNTRKNFIQPNYTSKYKRITEQTMMTYQCCGWERVEEMIFNQSPALTNVYPCECCAEDMDFVESCTINYKNPTSNESVCRSDSIYFESQLCRDVMTDVFEEDLNYMTGLIIITGLIALVSIFIKIRLSTALLDLYNSSD